MNFEPTTLQGSYLVSPGRFEDNRGWFSRFYCGREFEQIGHTGEWVQMNHSFTRSMGTVRGMHFQHPPHSEIKMVKCIAGAVYDVIVDLRAQSPTYLKYFATELSAENRNMLYIPEGFAHGFQALTDNCELIYLHSAYYEPAAEGGLRYNDPLINIQWPLEISLISERDLAHPDYNAQS